MALMRDELLGCPFCGSSAICFMELKSGGQDRVALACNRCESVGPPAPAAAARSAMEAWNRRAYGPGSQTARTNERFPKAAND